jgi:flagellar hook-associated protein 2
MAGAISFSGLGSGLDFSKLVDAAVADRMRPVTRLQTRSADLTKRSDALKQLNGKLAALTDAAKALTAQDLGTGRLSLSSDTKVVAATNTSAAAPGTINLNVTRLASGLTQSSRAYASSAGSVLAGGATEATFELRKGGAASGTPITITSANNTLTGLRDAINGANAGVTAAVVDVDGKGTQFKLVLSSNETGSAGRVELVETTATGTGADLGLTALNVTGGDYSQLDAALQVNGLPITRSSNNVSDAVAGMTFSLKGTGAATVSVTANTSEVTQKLQSFVAAYNDVQDFIAAQYKTDGGGKPTGVLAGDPTLRTVQQQLREAVGAVAAGNGGAFTNLTQIGFGRDNDGRLTLDTAVLGDKLSKSQADVKALLVGKSVGGKGIAQSLYDSYNRLSDTLTGAVQTAITGYQNSVKSIDKSISEQLARIETMRNSLSRQFAAADAAINQLNGQGTSLTNMLDSHKPKTGN